MYTLGINAVYHDLSACLVKDGRVVAAAEEERFTHIKHGKRAIPFSTYELPFNAINYCLQEADIKLVDVDHIAYSYDPFLLLGKYSADATITLPLEPSAHATEWEAAWDPLFLSSIVNAPRHLVGGVPLHLQERFRGARFDGPFRWHFVKHHIAHAASAFIASPFEQAAVLTLDGRGERASTTYSLGNGNALGWLGQVDVPHSLGLLYEWVTEYLGFLPSSDEYKVMALASFGKPTYLSEFREIVQLGENGQYTIQPPRLKERFGPPRLKGGPLEQRHYDIAHSLQVVLEETVLELVSWLHRVTGVDALCIAGGVALNCVLNARIRDRGPFKQIWVQPAAGDAGTSLGAALWIDALERATSERVYRMEHAFLGPQFAVEEIEQFLRWSKLPYRRLENIAEETADILAQDKVIGWFQGRMEFGPRALGARSILASPLHASMQAKLNDIKDREDFRPVAPVVLEEEAAQWFANADVSPFMLFVYDVLPEKAELIPAVRHVDGTARIQTINREQHPLYYDLIKAFQARTGVPVLVNTSFNTRGEPIVCTPRDAIESFWTSPLDALVIGPFLLEKA
ncbi:MAG TPA: carbamoyltransferase C-terminal domain-containing protein [Ktedonobacteraceae bacterium]|nr:carbamoyltransferase C-terminal domain-containing protein [Ktedonobacteraceae bacterium]